MVCMLRGILFWFAFYVSLHWRRCTEELKETQNVSESLATSAPANQTLPPNSDGRAEICEGTFQVAEAAGRGKVSAVLLESTQHVQPLWGFFHQLNSHKRKMNAIRKPWCRRPDEETFQCLLKSQTMVTCKLFLAIFQLRQQDKSEVALVCKAGLHLVVFCTAKSMGRFQRLFQEGLEESRRFFRFWSSTGPLFKNPAGPKIDDVIVCDHLTSLQKSTRAARKGNNNYRKDIIIIVIFTTN